MAAPPPSSPPDGQNTAPDSAGFVPAQPLTSPSDVPRLGRYRVLEALGEGGMGEVSACFDPDLGRLVARKSAKRASAATAALLRQEARLMAWLDHPGVVPVYALEDAESEAPAYAMKVLRGETLWERLRRAVRTRQPIPLSEALRVVTRICEAMANAHDKGVLHLDLKAGNVMLEPGGGVLIIDWGLAHLYDPEPYAEHLARGGERLDATAFRPRFRGPAGTPAYMPPEQLLEHRSALGPETDVFAVGVLFYRLLTLKSPYPTPAKTPPEELGEARLKSRCRPVHELRADVSAGLSAICQRMLETDRARRYRDLHAVLADLAALHDAGGSGLVRTLEAGEVLLAEGERSDRVFLVLDGEVAISITTPRGGKVVAHRGIGEILGEMAWLSDAPRSATVTATRPTRVRELSQSAIQAELDKVSPLVARLVRNLSDRLIEQTDRERSGWEGLTQGD